MNYSSRLEMIKFKRIVMHISNNFVGNIFFHVYFFFNVYLSSSSFLPRIQVSDSLRYLYTVRFVFDLLVAIGNGSSMLFR